MKRKSFVRIVVYIIYNVYHHLIQGSKDVLFLKSGEMPMSVVSAALPSRNLSMNASTSGY